MSTWGWIIVGVAVAVFVLISFRLAVKHRRTGQLRDRFGHEYDRTVESAASKREAEADLAQREQRHDEREIRPLSAAALRAPCRELAAGAGAVRRRPERGRQRGRASIETVMAERGYPVENFDQRADDLSVDYPEVVENSGRLATLRGRERPGTCAGRFGTSGRCSSSCSAKRTSRRR